MKTEEELRAGWKVFSDKMPVLVAEGSMQSTFAFIRVDTFPDGGMVTHLLAYNLTETTYLGMAAYILQSLNHTIQKGNNSNAKHNISRVLNLFNKLFQAKSDVANKKELN